MKRIASMLIGALLIGAGIGIAMAQRERRRRPPTHRPWLRRLHLFRRQSLPLLRSK